MNKSIFEGRALSTYIFKSPAWSEILMPHNRVFNFNLSFDGDIETIAKWLQ